MTNIELELLSEINLDQALWSCSTRSPPGRALTGPGLWPQKPIQKHLQHARKHLDLLASRSAGEDHLAHADCRLLMALELRERAGHSRAVSQSAAKAAPWSFYIFRQRQRESSGQR